MLAAGAIPIVLGGDHSIAEPDVRACAKARGGPVGLIHFDAHTDTGELVFGSSASHGTPMRHLVDDGHVDGARYVQIGLRGYWPGPEEFAWQREQGITSHFMHDVRERGIEAVVDDAIATVGEGPVFLSVDVDVLDPSVAPGTGTPEPGGMSAADLLGACRTIAQPRRPRRRRHRRGRAARDRARPTSPRSSPTASRGRSSPGSRCAAR